MRIATRTCNKQLTKQDPNAVTRASLPAQHTALSCKQCTRSVVLARLVTHKKRDGLRGKMSSKTARAAIALKSGVVMGGTAILSAVNGLTPHMAGAIDIMVVQQPDGTLKCSPFYVRFGKYTPMRSKDKKVHILINGEQADISMHLGAYGQAYFAAQTMEIVSDAEDEDILQGMMSPPSGYSSDEDAPYANQEILSAVQQEVQRIKATQQAAKAAAVAAASGEQPASPKAVAAAAAAKATGAAAIQQLAAAGEADTIAEAAAAADAQAGMSNVEAAAAHGINPATVAAAAAAVAAVIGQLDTSAGAAVEQALQSLDAQASTRAGQAEAGRESDSSSGLSDTLTSDDVARAITNGLATANNSSSRPHVAYSSGHQAGSPAAQQDSSSVGNSPTISSSSTSNKPYKKHRRPTPLVLHVPGDGAAEDPARSKLQDLLLDNRYSVRVRSENSFTASEAGAAAAQAAQLMMDDDILQQQQEQDDQQQLEQQQQQPQGDVRFLNDAGALHWKLHHDDLQLQKQQQQHQQHPAPSSPQQHQQDGGEQQAEPARRHVGFEVSSPPSQFHNSAVAATGGQQRTASRLRPSEAAIASKLPAGSSGLKRILQGNLPSVLDSAASYSVDEVSGLTLSADGDVDRTSSMASVDSPIAAAAAEQAAGEASSTAASTIGDQQELGSAELAHSEPLAVQNSSSNNEHEVLSSICETGDVQQRRRNRDGLLSSSLRATAAAQQQLAEQQQQPVQPAPKQQQPMASTSSGVVSQEQCSAPAPSTTIGLSDSTFDIQPQPAGQAAEDAESAAAGSTVAAPKTPGVHSSPDLGVSSPVVVPNGPAASPPVDHSGYLGDSEQGELLGTSLDATTPRRLAAAVDMGSGSGPLALGLAGFQLSLCGNQLRPGMPAAEAQQVFETQRVPAQMWSERGVGLMNDPNLVVKVGGSLYSWEVAAPIVVGMLAFGGKWDSLLGLDPSGIYPIKVAEDHSSTSKKSGGGSSWRLWPFSGWRESGSNKQQAPLGSSPPPSGLQQQRQQSQPSAATAGTGSSGDRDSAGDAVQSSGSSLTNLLLLGSPGSKSAALEKATYSVSADAGSTAQQAATAAAVNRLFGGSPRATSGGSKSVAFATSPESSPFRSSRKKHIILIRKTLTPPSDQLARLPLKWGQNTITFRATGAADLTAYIYLLRWNTRLVISDVDGTITRSDLLGHVLPTLGVDWSHPGITQLFHNIDSNGYQIMFLSSRAIAQANITREYLHSLVQDGYKMPSGPVIISPHGLLPSLYREIVVRRPHEFKIACLQDIRALFPPNWNPFYAGFGNRDTDEVSYKEVGVPLSRTFTINPRGQIQKAATAVQSSTWSSLSAINELVHEIFPALLAAIHQNSSGSGGGSRGARSVRNSGSSRRRFEDWELAAAAGIIGEDVAAAALAVLQEQEQSGSKCRSSGSTAEATGGMSSIEGQGGAMAGSDAGSSSTSAGAAAIAAPSTAGSAAVDAMNSAETSCQAQLSSLTIGLDSSNSVAQEAYELEIEDVGPSRDEYNDLQYWRPSLSYNIQEELELLQPSKQQQQPPQQNKSLQRQFR